MFHQGVAAVASAGLADACGAWSPDFGAVSGWSWAVGFAAGLAGAGRSPSATSSGEGGASALLPP